MTTPSSRSSTVRQVIEDHARTGDPRTGDGAEWLCVYAKKRGISDDDLAAYGMCPGCGNPLNDGEMFRDEWCSGCEAGELPSWWGSHGGICRGCSVLCEDCPDG